MNTFFEEFERPKLSSEEIKCFWRCPSCKRLNEASFTELSQGYEDYGKAYCVKCNSKNIIIPAYR